MRARPTEEQANDFRSRLRYLLEVTGKTPHWVEEQSGELTRGEVWRMAKGSRGKRPGERKVRAIAEALGVFPGWLFFGVKDGGRIFLDDPPPEIAPGIEQRLVELVAQELQRQRPPSTPPVPTLRPSSRPGAIAPKRR